MALQHLRSSTANKRPTPGAMSDGQLALNTNLVSPGLFFKDSNGDSVKIGPVHVGTTAPNVTPGAGGQAGNSKGEQWLDTTGGVYVFKIYDGTAWRSETGTFVDVNGDTMTGALGIIAGSAASPGLFFSGDANSGLYSPGADQVAVATNGTGRLFIDSSGNVGIGTASPNDYANYSTLTLNDTTGSIIDFEANGTICGELQALANEFRINAVGASGVLKMYAGATERLRITSAGLVGVGTSSPSSLLHLVSSGQPTITVADDGGRTLQVKAPDGSANPGFVGTTTNHNLLLQAGTTAGGLNVMRFNTAGAERVRITDTGRVGIGTSSPVDTLHVVGSARFGDGTNFAGVSAGASGSSFEAAAGSANLLFKTGGTTRAFIDSSGRVGIGTTSPSAPLCVQGAANSDQLIVTGLNGLSRGLKISTGADYANDSLVKYDSQYASGSDYGAHAFLTGGQERLRLDRLGRLLVGTSSNRTGYNLQLEGSTGADAGASFIRNETSNSGGSITLGKSGGTTDGSFAIVANNDALGTIAFTGARSPLL
jgi:hypothetical protein